ncbi:MAG: tetratricopeptide repeat protein, partial [bacterium]
MRSNLRKSSILIVMVSMAPGTGPAQQISGEANKYYQKGIEAPSLDERVRQLRKAIEIEPLFGAAVFHLGKSYYQMGEYQQAIEELSRAVRLDSAFHRKAQRYLRNAYTFVAQELNDDGHSPLALSYTQQALEIDENYAPALRALGAINLKLGDLSSALRALDRSLAINPNQELAWSDLGDLYLKMEVYDKAVAAFEHALEINPDLQAAQSGLEMATEKNRPAFWLAKATAALAQADSESARGFLQKALILNPRNKVIAEQCDSLSRQLGQLPEHASSGDSNLVAPIMTFPARTAANRQTEESNSMRVNG